MRVLIRKHNQTNWRDVSNFVNMPITISDTCDDTFDSIKLELFANTSNQVVDIINGLSPKSDIVLTETLAGEPISGVNNYWAIYNGGGVSDADPIVNYNSTTSTLQKEIDKWLASDVGVASVGYIACVSFEDENGQNDEVCFIVVETEFTEQNTYWFRTTKSPKARIRKQTSNDSPALYKMEINGVELIKGLEDTNMPNYTITQPKTQFYNPYNIVLNKRFTYNKKVSHDTITSVEINSPISTQTLNMANNDANKIVIQQGVGNYIYLKLEDIDKLNYYVSLNLRLARTTPRSVTDSFGSHIYSVRNANPSKPIVNDILQYITIRYYNSSSVMLSQERFYFDTPYNGGSIATNYNPIKTLGQEQSVVNEFRINRRQDASYAQIDVELFKNEIIKNGVNYNDGEMVGYKLIPTQIAGFDNDTFVKTEFKSIELNVESSQILDIASEIKYSLLEFVNKALSDYNVNRRNKITLNGELKAILSVDAKESEWTGYDFRELVIRACKYVNVVPYLNASNELNYVKTPTYGELLEIENFEEYEDTQEDENFYDTVMSDSKNLVSDKDFTKERVLIGSASNDFSQFEDNNAGFVLSNDIYYLGKAFLHTPSGFNISITTNNGTYNVNSNTDKANVWDITSRLFDRDIYNSLPDVNFASKVARSQYNLSKGNTIYFSSGSNIIGGLGHQAPIVPSYDTYLTGSTPSEYAIVELLTCLAMEYVLANHEPSLANITNPNPNKQLSSIVAFELEIDFIKFHKEISTKFISNKKERAALHYEKRLNASDRVMAFGDTEQTLVAEMNRKGNKKRFVSKTYKSFSDTLPTGSRLNDGLLTITSKRLLIDKNYVNCEYTLDENYLEQNIDSGLSVKYDKYNVPFEYVNRELRIDNHLLFHRAPLVNDNDVSNIGCNLALVEDIIAPKPNNDRQLDGYLYAEIELITQRNPIVFDNVLMRMSKLEGKNTMILSGSFLDNYSAGIQRFVESGLYYTQPYRYGNYLGRVLEMKKIKIGYRPMTTANTSSNSARLSLFNGSTYSKYPLDKFPSVYPNNDTNKARMTVEYLNDEDLAFYDKDGREAISLNFHTFLETIDENIMWYSFKGVNAIGSLLKDIPLTDDLTMANTPLTYHPTIGVGTMVSQVGNSFRVRITIPDVYSPIYNFNEGAVLLNKSENAISLVGIIKKPTLHYTGDNKYIEFYVTSKRYGK